MNEPMTGEVNKMVRYVWRILDDNRFVVDVYDMPIGEVNNQVLRIHPHPQGEEVGRAGAEAASVGQPRCSSHTLPDAVTRRDAEDSGSRHRRSCPSTRRSVDSSASGTSQRRSGWYRARNPSTVRARPRSPG